MQKLCNGGFSDKKFCDIEEKNFETDFIDLFNDLRKMLSIEEIKISDKFSISYEME